MYNYGYIDAIKTISGGLFHVRFRQEKAWHRGRDSGAK